jgi:hypothetical protein
MSNLISNTSEWTFPLLKRSDDLPAAIRRVSRASRTRVRARYLRQSDRGHLLGTDDRRLLVGRPADQLPSLVVRQAVRLDRADLSARSDGPRLRDRHQFRPLHCLPYGGEYVADAGPGHCSRLLWPQQLLQGQLSVQTWTSADAIIDYLVFARKYIAECEERMGLMKR